MSLVILPRSQWGAVPPRRRTLVSPSSLKGVVVHWFGSPRANINHDRCDDLLRSVQRSHMFGEFVDIAYNHAVCIHGVVYKLRGFGVQTGANGTTDTNEEYSAIVAMIGEGDLPNPKVFAGLKGLIGAWRSKGAGRQVRTHGSITGSRCPGREITAWVNASKFENLPRLPGPVPKPDEWWSWANWKRTKPPRGPRPVPLSWVLANWSWIWRALAAYNKIHPPG